MDETLPFRRARKPEERELRRETILAAAAELFDAEGPQGTGLTAIAAKAGFTKSNVYRYFESREEVLLSLFLTELEQLCPDLEQRFSAAAPGDVDALAAALAAAFIGRPRLASLSTIVSSTLEQNISEPAVVTLKRGMGALLQRAAAMIHAILPGSTPEDCAWVIAMVGTIVAGMWPAANPSETARRVLAMPEFAHLKPSLERDLERAARALLASVARG
jgi:AcrR family transcriptional regulator